MMRILRRFWYFISGRQEIDLADEIAFHREMKAEELRDRGVCEAEIAAATARAIGNDLRERERSRDVWVWPWLQDMSQDFRLGARTLLKDRRFTLAAILALGLGIAVNNSVFSIVNLAFFRQLPFEDPGRLVDPILVDERGQRGPVSYADFLDWKRAASFEGLVAESTGTMNLSDDELGAERMRGNYITANAFRLLRTAPILGRDFTDEDDRPGAAAVAILSFGTWQSRYGGAATTVGRTIRVNGVPTTVIGVMPQGFGFPMATQIWLPLSVMANLNPLNRQQRNLNLVGRLAAGVDLPQAQAELQGIAARIAQIHPETNKNLKASMSLLRDAYWGGGQAQVILGTLMAAVVFVLLIACANVTSLLLARSTHRSREMAIRASLGASRWRIVRQLLIECVLIAGLATVFGLVLSTFGAAQMAEALNVHEIGAPGVSHRPYWVNLNIDAVMMAFIGAIGLFASLGIGLLPAWHLSRTQPNDILKDGGRAGATPVRARRATGALIVAQLALTLVLLSCSGLLMRSFFSLYLTDLVVDTTGVVTMRLVLPVAKYPDAAAQQQFAATLDERLSALPVFASVALGSDIPLHPLTFAVRSVAIDEPPPAAIDELPSVSFVMIGPRYFETLGVRLAGGRGLEPQDALRGQESAIVNTRFADRFFPGADAIGRRIWLANPTQPNAPAQAVTIVGVSASLPNLFPDRQAESVVYVPQASGMGQQRAISIIVKAADPAVGKAVAVTTLREQVRALDPDLPVFGIQTLDEAAAFARFPNRILSTWFLVIAGVALVLATVGLYALTAHGVAQRAHEIGVRMALGAQAREVTWLFVRRTVVQLAIGLLIGVSGALAVGRLLTTFLRGTNPRDPVTIAIVSVLLIVVALVASVWPARRAARVDPVVALRAD